MYCSFCGQKDIELLKFNEILKDFFDHIFDLDSRIFSTFKHLMTRPGFLTMEYWKGKRTKYIPPFKIYLITSFLYFFTSSFLPVSVIDSDEGNAKNEEITSSNDSSALSLDYLIDDYEKEIELFFLLPITALGLSFLNRNKKTLFFSHHFIASIHLSSAWFIMQIFIDIFETFFPQYSVLLTVSYIFLLLYANSMIKNLYRNSLTLSIFKTFILALFVIVSMMIFVAFVSLFFLITSP